MTVFTSMFLHGGWLHVGMNIAVALSVSTPVALVMGRGILGFLKFWVLFLLCGLLGGLAYVAIQPNSALPAIGASGAISGLWGAMVRIPFAPGPLDPPWSRKALSMSVPFLLINVLLMAALTRFGVLPVAWEAHLGGFVAGMILISFFAVRLPRRLQRRADRGVTAMAEVVNLNKTRKAKAKTDRAAQAKNNRVVFGRTKADKKLSEADRRLADRKLDEHERD